MQTVSHSVGHLSIVNTECSTMNIFNSICYAMMFFSTSKNEQNYFY